MTLYLIVFLAALVFAFLSDVCERQIVTEQKLSLRTSVKRSLLGLRSARTTLIICSALVLVVLSGVRYDTGYDYMYSYVPSLETVRAGDASHYDPFFNFIISIFAKLNDNQWFFAATAAYTVFMMYLGFVLESKYVTVPVALYFCSFNYLRSFCFVAQYTAMATLFVGFILLLKKKYIGAVVLLIVGVLLHKSAEIMIVFYLCYFLSTKVLLIISLFFPVIAEIGHSFFRSIIVHFASGSRFDEYIAGQYDVGYEDTTLITVNLLAFAIFLLVILYEQKNVVSDKKAMMFFLAQSLALGFACLQTVIPVGYRFVWYFALFQIVSIPYMLKYVLHGALFYIACGLICAAYYYWMIKYPIASGASQILPYHPYFNPEITIE